jgi:hypothetical protein
VSDCKLPAYEPVDRVPFLPDAPLTQRQFKAAMARLEALVREEAETTRKALRALQERVERVGRPVAMHAHDVHMQGP